LNRTPRQHRLQRPRRQRPGALQRSLIAIGLIGALALAGGVLTRAQPPDPPADDAPATAPAADADDGFLLRFINDLLSAPGREVRIREVSGALSSQATIGEISVADADGVWLRVRDLRIDWSRRALFLRRLSINELSIGSIDLPRPPLPVEPRAEAEPFSLPELPLQVLVDAVRVAELRLGEPVLGAAASLRAAGAATLIDGSLDAELRVTRLDDPGGELSLHAAFANDTRRLDLDLALAEPPGGLVATALDIEGRPAIDLRLAGQGPLEQVDIDFTLDADGTRLATGTLALREAPAGLGFVADFAGELAPLVPADYRDFFAGRTAVYVAGVNLDPGGLRIDALRVAGAVLSLEGALALGADGFLEALSLTGELADPQGEPVTLPVPGAQTRLGAGTLRVGYGAGSRWDGRLVLEDLRSADIEVADVTLDMGGLAEHLQEPARRNVTVVLAGTAAGIRAEDPALRAALGERIDLNADIALPPDAPIAVRSVRLGGAGFSVVTSGTLDDLVYAGELTAELADLAPFSGLAGRDLAGQIDLRATGEVLLASGGFDLRLAGGATGLRVGEPTLDPLLAGETSLSGRVRRDETGLHTDALRIENPQLAFASTGRVAAEATDIGFDARLADLALLTEQASGALTARGRAAGRAGEPIDLRLTAGIAEGSLVGRRLAGVALAFDGARHDGDLSGRLDGEGRIGGETILLAGELGLTEDTRALTDFRLEVGPNAIVGDLAQRGEAPVEGNLTLTAPDLAPLAALALTEAEGAAAAKITLGPARVGQGVRLRADVRDLVIADNRVDRLDLQADIVDAFGVPLADATLNAGGIAAAGIEIERLAARAEQTGPAAMAFFSEAQLAVGTDVRLAGGLARLAEGLALRLDRLLLAQNGLTARLLAPATITLVDDAVTLSPLALDVAGGRIEARGRVAEAIAIDVDIERLPLDIVDTLQPELGLTGSIDGTAQVTGPRAAPRIGFDLSAADIGAAPVQAAGLPRVDLTATGSTAGDRLALDARLSSPAGVAARATGSVPIGAGNLDLAIDLDEFRLPLLDPLAGDIGLTGRLTGSAQVTGTLDAPAAAFNIAGSGIGASVPREGVLPPLELAADGRFADGVLTLTRADVSGPGDIALDASGRLPLAGSGLALSVTGNLPLALADVALAERGARLAGRAALDLAAGGSLAAPTLTGAVTIADATFIDPQTNLRIDAVQLASRFDGTGIVIERLTGESALGGTLSVSGRIGVLEPDLPARLGLRLDELAYTDGTLLATTLDGAIELVGPLAARGGRIEGRIDLGLTEISVAEGLGAAGGAALEAVSHRNTPPEVARTLERARRAAPAVDGDGDAPAFDLDVLLRAPNRIFIRGRGLDVEVGGELRLQGTTNDLAPVGEFTLRRGRLDILAQRIDFDEASVRLLGDLDPRINLTASTVTRDATATVNVSGRASDPVISFSSQPPLPDDEVLALILFNRTTQQLSPFQIAQLALAAAELTGASPRNGLLDPLRGAFGFDDLDVVTDETGGAGVRAGRYLDENIYLDVQTGTAGGTRTTINLDVTDNITVQGGIDTRGDSRAGIFYNRDY
jgi:translocation and assembly module TamB